MNKYYNPEKRHLDYLKNKKRDLKRNKDYMKRRRLETRIKKYQDFLIKNGYIVTKLQGLQ